MVTYGKKLATLPGLFRPYLIMMDNEQLYVLDAAVVSIYSLKDFSLRSKFGKEGEGPEEFKLNPNKEDLFLFPHPDYLLISSLGKVSFYTKDGKFIKELRTETAMMSGNYQTIGDKFAGMGMSRGGNASVTLTINLVDEKFNKTKEIYSQNFMERGGMTFPMVFPMFFVEDNKIIAPGGEEFALNILDGDGNKIAAVTRDYSQLKVGDDYKKSVHNFFKTSPATKDIYDVFFKNTLKFTEYFPAIRFFVVDKGKIYIQTYLEEDGKQEFFIYDLKGKFLKRLFLPITFRDVLRPYPLTVKNDTLYQLLDNEDEEEWELHAVEIK